VNGRGQLQPERLGLRCQPQPSPIIADRDDHRRQALLVQLRQHLRSAEHLKPVDPAAVLARVVVQETDDVVPRRAVVVLTNI